MRNKTYFTPKVQADFITQWHTTGSLKNSLLLLKSSDPAVKVMPLPGIRNSLWETG